MDDAKTYNLSLPFPGDYKSMYDFFCIYENSGEIITMPMISDRLFSGNYKQARKYVQVYWSWFLICVNNKTKPYKYKVTGIKRYDRQYFADAHEKGQMHYFYHFVESMKAYNVRKQLRDSLNGKLTPREDLDQDIEQLYIQLDVPLEDEEEFDSDVNEIVQDSEAEEILLSSIIENSSTFVDSPETSLPFSPLTPSRSSISWIVFVVIIIIVAVIGVVYLLLRQRE
jgi:hypothetical protein